MNFRPFQIGFMTILSFLLIIEFIIIVNKSKNNDRSHIKKQDTLLTVLLFVCFYGITLFYSIVTNNMNLIIYFMIFSILATIFEFVFGWFYYILNGSRLYRYYRNDLLGFSSINMLPLWGGASLYFYGMWLLFDYKDVFIEWKMFVLQFFGFLGLVILVMTILFSFRDLIKNKFSDLKSRPLMKYLFISCSFIGGITGLLAINKKLYLFPYFLITTLIGVFLEGILGKFIKKVFGENFWIYYKKPIMNKYTTFVAFPFWLGANALAFLLFINIKIF